ncbi:MAG: SAM-dependent methyltransferase [Mariniblastus sp.]
MNNETDSQDPASEQDPSAKFIYVICQNGAESATKLELMTSHPNLKLAFSRPGFITFKIDDLNPLPERFTLRSTLARSYGWSLGKVVGDNATELVADLAKTEKLAEAKAVHVWQRDPVLPGRNGFEPGVSALAREVGNLFAEVDCVKKNEAAINVSAKPDELVFDVVMVEPGEWWFGYHIATTVAGRWPGGVPTFDSTIETFSRAYLKLKEALLWSGIRIEPGDLCAEIGSAPGGACQLLLEKGAEVLGIDPAEMEQEIFDHENFTHIRRRGGDVKKRDFRNVKWLMADLNVDPDFTIDLAGEIVAHEAVDIKGLVLTLKLTDWKMVSKIPGHMAKVKEMGFKIVKARQLAFNRQEYCLVAVKDKFILRMGKKR